MKNIVGLTKENMDSLINNCILNAKPSNLGVDGVKFLDYVNLDKNIINEEFIKKLIMLNGKYIKLIDNPSEEIQLMAVMYDCSAIKYIKHPTFNVKYYVIKSCPWLIPDIKDLNYKLCKMAVCTNFRIIKIIDKNCPWFTKNGKLYKLAIKNNPFGKILLDLDLITDIRGFALAMCDDVELFDRFLPYLQLDDIGAFGVYDIAILCQEIIDEDISLSKYLSSLEKDKLNKILSDVEWGSRRKKKKIMEWIKIYPALLSNFRSDYFTDYEIIDMIKVNNEVLYFVNIERIDNIMKKLNIYNFE